MALTQSTQVQISYKHLSGKSQTSKSNDVHNEFYSYSMDGSAENIWISHIPSDPTEAQRQGVTVKLYAELGPVEGSGNESFLTLWPNAGYLPNEIDVLTGMSYSYGVGTLKGVDQGQRMTQIISDKYGTGYMAKPGGSINQDPTTLELSLGSVFDGLDPREWVYQYNSGILYIDNKGTYSKPSSIQVYPYVGEKLNYTSDYTNVIVTATGLNSYSSTTSIPTIATYSSDHLYITKFTNVNTSGTVSLNINSLGTYSVLRWRNGEWGNLLSSEISVDRSYYLTWVYDRFHFHEVYPVGNISEFTDTGESNKLVGDLPVFSSFQNVNYSDMFENILYGERLGNIEFFELTAPTGSISILELGDNIPASTLTFSWGLTNSLDFVDNSLKLIQIGSSVIATGSSNVSPYTWVNSSTISHTSETTETFVMYLQRSNNTIISKKKEILWRSPIYYGSTTSATISNVSGFTKISATNSNFILDIQGSGYKYLAIPDNFPTLYSLTTNSLEVVMAGTSNGYTFSDSKSGSYNTSYNSLYHSKLDIGNIYGVTSSYKVYRTEYQINSSLIVISKDSL